MIKFEEWLMNLEYPVPMSMETADLAAGEPRTTYKFKDVCKRKRITTDEQEREWRNKCNQNDTTYCGVKPKVTWCERSHTPLDFIYERKTDSYALENYHRNSDLIKKV